jgi:hypothetical protein
MSGSTVSLDNNLLAFLCKAKTGQTANTAIKECCRFGIIKKDEQIN